MHRYAFKGISRVPRLADARQRTVPDWARWPPVRSIEQAPRSSIKKRWPIRLTGAAAAANTVWVCFCPGGCPPVCSASPLTAFALPSASARGMVLARTARGCGSVARLTQTPPTCALAAGAPLVRLCLGRWPSGQLTVAGGTTPQKKTGGGERHKTPHRRRAAGRCVDGRRSTCRTTDALAAQEGFTNSGGDPLERVTGLRVGHRVFEVNDAPTSANPSTVLV